MTHLRTNGDEQRPALRLDARADKRDETRDETPARDDKPRRREDDTAAVACLLTDGTDDDAPPYRNARNARHETEGMDDIMATPACLLAHNERTDERMTSPRLAQRRTRRRAGRERGDDDDEAMTNDDDGTRETRGSEVARMGNELTKTARRYAATTMRGTDETGNSERA